MYKRQYENYGEYYHKRRIKKPSTAVQVGALSQTNERERSICNERKRVDLDVYKRQPMEKSPNVDSSFFIFVVLKLFQTN